MQKAVPFVQFVYFVFTPMKAIPFVEFVYLVFTSRMVYNLCRLCNLFM